MGGWIPARTYSPAAVDGFCSILPDAARFCYRDVRGSHVCARWAAEAVVNHETRQNPHALTEMGICTL